MKVKEVSAKWANFFEVFVGERVRLVFGEQVLKGDDTEYHTAILTDRANAKLFAELILKTIAEREANEANEKTP